MTAVFILPPEVDLLDIAGPAHIFCEAARYADFVKLTFASISSETSDVASNCPLTFTGLVSFDSLEIEKGDMLFVPGLKYSLLSDSAFTRYSRDFQKWLAGQYSNGATICSIGTGAFILAEAGLLDGKNCTTHWLYAERFRTAFPSVNLLANRLFVEDEEIYTSAGAASGIDLALYLVEKIWGDNISAKIAKESVVYFRRTATDPQLNIFTQYRDHLESRIHNIQGKLSRSIGTKLNIKELAEEIGMSPRNLTRQFKKTTGITIGDYLAQLRSVRARQFLAQGHTMQSAAIQCGLKSTNQLRGLLKKYPPE